MFLPEVNVLDAQGYLLSQKKMYVRESSILMYLKPFLHQKAFVNVSWWLMNSQDEVKQQIILVYKDYHVSQKDLLVIIVF